MEESKRNLLDESFFRYMACAIDLKIPEAIENHPSSQPVTLTERSSAVSASPSHLRRIMRFLVHQGLFKEVPTKDGLATGYTNTPLSRRSFASLGNKSRDACSMCTVRICAGACHGLFDGVATVVDVGGGTGDTMGILVKEFPWIKGFNFDLPHVIEVAQVLDGVENVEGDMFDSIPACDAVIIKWVLHDWGDKDCIKILKNCKEAVPPNVGKLLIVECVIGEKKNTMVVEERDDKLEHVRLQLDMVMMVHTSTGKERTLKEWDFVLKEAGFARYEVRDIDDIQSLRA
ncbi:hypothetical protein ARALYDRAFT_491137, partial [Arabidopsis lyrata subsp. lyrata]